MYSPSCAAASAADSAGSDASFADSAASGVSLTASVCADACVSGEESCVDAPHPAKEAAQRLRLIHSVVSFLCTLFMI